MAAPLLGALRAACVGEEAIVTVLLQQAIVESPPPTIRDGGVIRPDYDATLAALVRETDAHRKWIDDLQVNVSALALNP